MSKHEINEKKPVITASFAHYCGPWEYDLVRELFAQRGYELLTPDSPISNPAKTLDDHAAALRHAEKKRRAKEYVNLGHSWSGDLIYRRLGSTPVSLLVFMGSPLRPVKENQGLQVDSNSTGLLYGVYKELEVSGKIDFERDRDMLGQALFKDIGDKAIQAWATQQIRPHPHKKESVSDRDPHAFIPKDVPSHFVGFENDKVFHFQGQKDTANLLNLEFSSMPTCHFAMLEKKELFVDRVIEIIEANSAKREEALQRSYSKVV